MPFASLPRALPLSMLAAAFAFAVMAYLSWRTGVAAAAGLAAVLVIVNGLKIVRRELERSQMAKAVAELTALAYAWGGVSMLLAYGPGGLKWQHGWQYGTGMLVIAALILVYASRLWIGSPLAGRRLLNLVRRLAVLQGLTCSTGLFMLIGSGKLETVKGDWAANDVFVAGGIAIVFASAFAVVTGPRGSCVSGA